MKNCTNDVLIKFLALLEESENVHDIFRPYPNTCHRVERAGVKPGNRLSCHRKAFDHLTYPC